jgi:hypothetical protein
MGGPGGGAPMAGGLGDVPPEQKEASCPQVGPKTPANPKPTGVGKW